MTPQTEPETPASLRKQIADLQFYSGGNLHDAQIRDARIAELRTRAEEMEEAREKATHAREDEWLKKTFKAVTPAPVAKGWTRGDALPVSAPGHWNTEAGSAMAQGYIDRPRTLLSLPDHSDFEVANSMYLASRESVDLVMYQTAAKDRIRWLSANLWAANAKLDTIAAENVRLKEDLAGALAALESLADRYENATGNRPNAAREILDRATGATNDQA